MLKLGTLANGQMIWLAAKNHIPIISAFQINPRSKISEISNDRTDRQTDRKLKKYDRDARISNVAFMYDYFLLSIFK